MRNEIGRCISRSAPSSASGCSHAGRDARCPGRGWGRTHRTRSKLQRSPRPTCVKRNGPPSSSSIRRGRTNGSNDTTLLGAPSGIDFDPAANEVYIADGYHVNQRVSVFDADTGAYKRHWGRYGLKPDDSFETGKQPMWMAPSPFLVGKTNNLGSFPRFAHGVNVSRDGLVYVADRSHGMIYVHRKDGTYIKEAPTPGPVNSVAFSSDPEQYYLYGNGINASARMYILRRSDLQVLGTFKSDGRHYSRVGSKVNL